MTSRQENKLNMYLAVHTFLNTNAAVVQEIPKYSEFFSLFSTGITDIKTLAEDQMFDKSGVRKSKKQLKLALASLAADSSRKLVAFAKFSNNQVLLSEISFTESKLKYANSVELRKFAQGIYTRAQSHIAELETYGINPATQTVLSDAITDYTEYIPQPRIVKASGKQYTSELADAIQSTDSALANIDTGLEILKLKNPNFYKEYKSVRKLILMGTGSVAIKGRVLDALTKEPIKNVDILFSMQNNADQSHFNGNGSISKKSAEKGGFLVKTIPAGIYIVSLNKNGYVKQKTTLAVTNGEMAKFEIELVRN